MIIILAILASLCFFAGLSMLIYWLLTTTTQLYVEGESRLGGYLVEKSTDEKSSLLSLAKRFGVIFLPINESLRDRDKLGVPMLLVKWEADLVRAGMRNELTPEQLLCMSEISAIVAGIFLFLTALVFGMGMFGALFLGLPAGLAMGFIVPGYIIKSKGEERVTIIEKRLPFAIEFMLLAMEASAALPEAMRVYSGLMPVDPLADEFRLVLSDIDRGLSQTQALRAMDERLQSDPLSAFILAVTIGLDTGQPIKEVFQTQAEATRRRRYQGAEEVAKKAGTKAILPLFVVLIGIIILVLGPMGIKMMQGGLF